MSRSRKVAGQLLHAVRADKRKQILARLASRHYAILKSEVSFPLSNLIRHLPSSKYWKKRQRRKISDTLITVFAERECISKKVA